MLVPPEKRVSAKVIPTFFFIPSMEGGGAEKVFLTLINSLIEQGYPIHLVLLRKKGVWLNHVDPAISIHCLNTRNPFLAIFRLYRLLSKYRAVNVFATLWHCNFMAGVVRKIIGSRMRLAVREAIYPPELLASLGLGERLIVKMYFHSYRFADAVICPSREILDYYSSALPPSVSCIRIPNPVAITVSNGGDLPIPDYLKEIKESGKRIIIGVGRLHEQKGFDVLINAFSTLRSHRAVLVILGEGAERKALEKQVCALGLENMVLMPGFVSDVERALAAADVFVSASRYEGYPNALQMAVAMNISIVATECPSGVREMLENVACARLVPVDNSQALSQAMSDALTQDRCASNSSGIDLNKLSPLAISHAYLEALNRD